MNNWTAILTFITACGAGIAGGVFFAFSTFVMGALVKLPPAQGLTAMQSINVVVLNVLFMTVLFGTGLLCVVLAGHAVWDWQRPGAGLRLSGSLIYLLGIIGMTIVFHVPRNDALATLDPTNPEAAAAWLHYAKVWTLGNHVRSAAGIAAMALLILGWRVARDVTISG